eukprot:CAMPEP_0178903354 /NCGR_PEP_ID=MMETSP0786-20121207/5111_1 /TAXON_ID=186022 /ORGANISM="Thalassionema frauenfeldii, Strain CCMP 1798" /LENGTH=517 /DNA_ID=CAMNT_0020574717 /DNA_START=125 /DNA_END=1675 /DNA_ORIENTATION=-
MQHGIENAALPDQCQCEDCSKANPPSDGGPRRNKHTLFPKRLEKLFAGAVRVDRDEFMNKFDLGVPKDATAKGNEDVVIFYHHPKSITNVTNKANRGAMEDLPSLSVDDATIKCHTLKIVLTEPNRVGQCMAIVGQWESYHIHKYMRVPADDNSRAGVSWELPLRSVARTFSANKGRTQQVPFAQNVKTFDQTILKPYLESLPDTLEKLQPIAEKVGQTDKTIIVLVCNLGQSELLVNFICHARAHKLDLSRVLVFCTDLETKKIVESFGLAAFYDEVNFDKMPMEAARSYGDRRFTGMMMAKVFCVHMLTQLNYNVLFQDVDVVWYRHPLEYFQNRTLNFDMYFQDDGAHSVRYAPYSPNTGFYFVKAVDRTRYFFNCLIKLSDLIQQSGSHQSALTAVLNEHVSYRGLKVKILSRDDDEFPGGFHYHRRKPYMKQLIAGKKQPYVFHMSWTTNKENKRQFFQQLGDWYNSCRSNTKIDNMPEQSANACCSVEPIIKCHYRDKPSIIPCSESSPID